MDTGGLNLFIVEVIGAVLLGAGILWAVLRTRSAGKTTSNPTTERATDQLYKQEEAKRRAGTDDDEA